MKNPFREFGAFEIDRFSTFAYDDLHEVTEYIGERIDGYLESDLTDSGNVAIARAHIAMLICLYQTFKGGISISMEQCLSWRNSAETIASKVENFPLEPWSKEDNDHWLVALREDFDELMLLLDSDELE